jgi:hypothetical protein
MRANNDATNDRSVGRAALAAVAVIGLIGALHAPFARAVLARFGGCPFAGATMTAAQADAARRMALARPRRASMAPARPALGFALDATTVAEARRWAALHRLACDEPREGLVRCARVPAQLLGLRAGASPVADLALEFDPGGHLVTATTFRSGLSAGEAAATASRIAASLGEALGDATARTGTFDPAHLARSPADSIATLAYHYADYVADVTAMRLASGVAVREQYMSARD